MKIELRVRKWNGSAYIYAQITLEGDKAVIDSIVAMLEEDKELTVE